MDFSTLIARRSSSINGSGIRRVFEIGAKIQDKVDLSIGQPDFPVPEPIRAAAIRAIDSGKNGYPLTRGVPELREKLARALAADIGWKTSELPGHADSGSGLFVTSGTTGALMLASLALLDPGDEVIIPDPWFVLYPYMATFSNSVAVPCDTYPDFRMTAERVERLITPRTKMVVLNSPSNPAGVVSTEAECRDLLDLCRRRNIILLSDEIYDEFTYSAFTTQETADGAQKRCPSPARFPGAEENVLVVRGFGKTYGVTGWRLGHCAGPRKLIEEMIKLQQYMYVSAPHPLQWGVMEALDYDMSSHVAEYERRRTLVVERLSPYTEVPTPGGAFYAFPKVPDRLGFAPEEAGEKFFQKCITERVLIVPGKTFSRRDTHFRLSYATPIDKLERGLDALVRVMKG
ncbi:MAG TPA: aminotransferase class I/II-fold pyridoxal phosphate-dependent enzyme [Phycisphaerales bacterium]|nr:aminotransferase class I/II-fold pyridoxal phosphate-dependent enzyme [Phycisphaerales bacterium]